MTEVRQRKCYLATVANRIMARFRSLEHQNLRITLQKDFGFWGTVWIELTYLFRPVWFQSVDGLKLGATSSDILNCVTYVTIRK